MSCGPEGEVVTDVALYRPEHLEDHLQQQAVSAEHGRKRRWHLSTLLSGLLVAVLALATPALMPLLDTQTFAPGACKRVEEFLLAHIVGQDMAINQLVDAVCTHIGQPHPSKPLILSVHGPPGVGKTYTHTLLARALYNRDPHGAPRCPGEDCRGAKVIYGLDFLLDSQQQQLEAVKSAILQHARSVRDPLIVIEEYDKLDCASRGMLRQLFSSPDLANATLNRAIVLLESNLGFAQLEEMVQATGRTQVGEQLEEVVQAMGWTQVTPEQAERALRDTVFAWWQGSKCEAYVDTLRFLSTVDFFLPYFPLQRPQIKELATRALRQWSAVLWREKRRQLEWGPEVVDFLVERVDFDGDAPLEGGKQVGNVATRYLARLIRNAPHAAVSGEAGQGGTPRPADTSPGTQRGVGEPGAPVLRLWLNDSALQASPDV